MYTSLVRSHIGLMAYSVMGSKHSPKLGNVTVKLFSLSNAKCLPFLLQGLLFSSLSEPASISFS